MIRRIESPAASLFVRRRARRVCSARAHRTSHATPPAAASRRSSRRRSRRRKRRRSSARRSTPISRAGYYERGQMDVALEELNEAQKLDPTNREDLQHLRPRLHDARRERRRPSRISSARSRSRPNDSDIRAQLGLVSCAATAGARESIPEFEQALRNPLYKTPEIALINAGKCSAAIGDIAQRRRLFPPRARAHRRATPLAAYNLALLAYREGAHRRGARARCGAVMQQPVAAARSALSRHVHRAQAGRSRRPSARTRRSCAIAIPDSAEAKALGRRGLRVTDELDTQPPDASAAPGRCRPARRCAPRARRPGLSDRRGRAAAEARAAPGAGARGRRLRAAARPHVRARLHAQLRALRRSLDPDAVLALLPGGGQRAVARAPGASPTARADGRAARRAARRSAGRARAGRFRWRSSPSSSLRPRLRVFAAASDAHRASHASQPAAHRRPAPACSRRRVRRDRRDRTTTALPNPVPNRAGAGGATRSRERRDARAAGHRRRGGAATSATAADGQRGGDGDDAPLVLTFRGTSWIESQGSRTAACVLSPIGQRRHDAERSPARRRSRSCSATRRRRRDVPRAARSTSRRARAAERRARSRSSDRGSRTTRPDTGRVDGSFTCRPCAA